MFKQVTCAYETLSNPQEREKYNIVNGIFKTTKASTSSKKRKNTTKKQKETQILNPQINNKLIKHKIKPTQK